MHREDRRETSLTLTASLDNLPVIQKFLRKVAARHCAEDLGMRLDLITEELVVNIVHYAYPKEQGKIECSCSVEEHDRQHPAFVIKIRDWGVPFNPLSKQATKISTDIDSRTPGGLGILLTRQMADDLEYRHEENCNILLVTLFCPKS